jgi:hypothetical protein
VLRLWVRGSARSGGRRVWWSTCERRMKTLGTSPRSRSHTILLSHVGGWPCSLFDGLAGSVMFRGIA